MRGYEPGLALIDRLRASDPSSPPTSARGHNPVAVLSRCRARSYDARAPRNHSARVTATQKVLVAMTRQLSRRATRQLGQTVTPTPDCPVGMYGSGFGPPAKRSPIQWIMSPADGPMTPA